jgi:hypothetical protein
MILENKLFRPTTHEKFWCNQCDSNVVDSMNPATGHFYLFSGHGFNAKSKTYDGDYHLVMCAFCSACEAQK